LQPFGLSRGRIQPSLHAASHHFEGAWKESHPVLGANFFGGGWIDFIDKSSKIFCMNACQSSEFLP
jgi:hypothetical protein